MLASAGLCLPLLDGDLQIDSFLEYPTKALACRLGEPIKLLSMLIGNPRADLVLARGLLRAPLTSDLLARVCLRLSAIGARGPCQAFQTSLCL